MNDQFFSMRCIGTGGPRDNPHDVYEVATADGYVLIGEGFNEQWAQFVCDALNATGKRGPRCYTEPETAVRKALGMSEREPT